MKSDLFINKIYKNSSMITLLLMIFSFLITSEPIYSFIVLLAAITGITGFFFSIKVLDRFLKNKKGKPLLFFVFFLKLIFISIVFYLISRISEKATLFFIAGISVIVMSMMLEGFLQIFNKNNKLNEG